MDHQRPHRGCGSDSPHGEHQWRAYKETIVCDGIPPTEEQIDEAAAKLKELL